MSEELKALLVEQREAILASVNDRISGLQDTILQKQEELASQIEAEDVTYQFKKKGNEQQFKLNAKVLKSNAKAIRALESGDTAKAKEAIQAGTASLNQRQKLIKLADKSEFGWATINEYLDDELADVESDARKIKKAEKRAADKSKSNQEKRRKSTRASSQFSSSTGRNASTNWPAHVPNLLPSPTYFRPSGRNSTRYQDLCFKCGRRGHWANDCSRISGSPNAGVSGSK